MASVKKREWTYKGETKSAWVVRWKVGKKHPSKQFDRKHEADAYKRKVEREVEDGTHVIDTESPTMSVLCEQFLNYQEQRMKDGRIGVAYHAMQKTAVDFDIVPFMGTLRVKDVEAKHVLDMYQNMCRRTQAIRLGLGKTFTPRQGLAPKTARARVSILKMIMDFAQLRGYVKRDIMTAAASQLRGIPRKKIRTFTIEMARVLIATAENRSVRGRHRAYVATKCFVYLAAFGGLRIGEIWGLTLGHLRLDEQLIEVRHSLTPKDVLKGPKTRAGIRDVAVPKFVCDVIREWLQRYYVQNDRQLVFRMEDGAQMRPGTFHTSYWRPLLKRAGLSNEDGDSLHFHALRHFYASWLIHNGASVMDVASRMGHESFDMTLGTYAHTVAGGTPQLAEVDAMAARLALPSPAVAQEVRTGS